jgi:hypothetical protein
VTGPELPVRRQAPVTPANHVKRAAMTVPARKLLEGEDPVLLELLKLAAEVILANPGVVPAELYDQCDDWAGALSAVLLRPSGQTAAARAAFDPRRTRRGAPSPAGALEEDLWTAFTASAAGFTGPHLRGTPARRLRYRCRALIVPWRQAERRWQL